MEISRAARRRWLAAAAAVGGLAALVALLLPVRDRLSLAAVTLLFLVPVLGAAVGGGLWPALGTAVVAELLVNFFFVPPFHTLRVATADNVIVLIVYVLVAATVALAVDLATRRAVRAQELAAVDRLRTGLLNAVSHDLRTPLAGIKAASSSLRQPDVDWAPEDRADLLATIEDSTDRMAALVENLLSLSRLQAGALSVALEPTALDAVVAEAVLGKRVDVRVPDDLPLALADPGLLERVIANLADNALKAAPAVRIEGALAGHALELRVVDDGPGIPPEDRARVFEPFQRRTDHGAGLGLGLAIARGFTEAMGGRLTPSDTPGGGLTMTVRLPVAPRPAVPR
jgi:two-component system sensor histidine kinase KdpD